MHIGLRIFFGFFLIVGLAAFLTLRVFVQEVKPGVRQAMEDTLADTAHVLAALATDDMKSGRIAEGNFARHVARLRTEPVNANVWGVRKDAVDYRIYVTDARGIVRFDSAGTSPGQDYSRWNDVYLTLRGEYGARSTRADPADERSTVMHVAAPIRDGDTILGVLTVAKPNAAMAPFIARSQHKIVQYGALLIGSAFVIGLACTLWLVHGLRQLRGYARAVAAGERAEMPLRGAGELAELGRAVQGMREQLEDKQYVERYIHTLAHEMKSPLAAISGAAELLQEEMPVADRRRFSANIRGQTRRLETMIRKLLALADVEQRQRLDSCEPVRVAALLAQLAEELEPRARQRAVGVRLAGAVADDLVDGDPFLLRQAVANLVENAIDFAPTGSTVTLALVRSGAVLEIEVRDAGPGIPDFALQRVFERFYSLPRPDGGDKSTGLGLCFAREVATLHRGNLSLVNRPEGGVLAVLALPVSS